MSCSSQSLIARNSLAVHAKATHWCDWRTKDELADLQGRYGHCPVFAYGEGSNVLLVSDIEALCLHATDQSVAVTKKRGGVVVEAAAGVHWNWLVHHCVANGWWGLENLVAIPGSCGAAPVQNIGAYGAELADCVVWVECIDWRTGAWQRLASGDCGFGYRQSIFKTRPGWIISRIALKLTDSLQRWRRLQQSRPAHSSLSTLTAAEKDHPQYFAAAIARLRASKLPDADFEPNVGSFFHNPIVAYAEYDQLADRMLARSAAWKLNERQVKLSAAWLIDQCLGKGFTRGRCGLSERHALCVVNKLGASGREIFEFAGYVQASVRSRFGVELVIEPKVVIDRS